VATYQLLQLLTSSGTPTADITPATYYRHRWQDALYYGSGQDYSDSHAG